MKSSLGRRLAPLFSKTGHDHGVAGFVLLESMAAGSMLGGATMGVVADAINKEDLKETASMKVKEGIFQFVGNVTFCTAAILGVSTLGKMGGQRPG